MSKENVSVFSARKKARRVLRETGLSAILLLLVFLCFFAFCGTSAFFEGVFVALSQNTPLPHSVGYVLAMSCVLCFSFFLLAPMWRGIHALLLGYLIQNRVDLSLVLCFFTAKKRYAYAVRASFSNFTRYAFFLCAIYATVYIGRNLALYLFEIGDKVRASLILSLTVFFSLGLLFMLFVLSAQRYVMDAVVMSAPLLKYRQTKAVSKFAVRGHLGVIFRHCISILLYVLLSLVCFGVPFLFLVPYALASKNVLATHLLKK